MKYARPLAALALALGVATCTPEPAAADLAPAEFWCASRRPHAADVTDGPTWNYWHAMGNGVLTARCRATHPGGGHHWYYTTVWDQDGDGVVELIQWTPLGPGWT